MKKILCLILCLTMLLGCTSALADEAAAAAAAEAAATMTVEELVAAAQGEGQLFSVGMPDEWANWKSLWAYITDTYGIKHSDTDMSSAEELARFALEGKADADIGDIGISMTGVAMEQDLLLPWKTILDNVCLYGKLHHREAQAREKALSNMETFGLAGYENSYPRELSGGMRQRAAFLRTALCEADILLLDEPFGALDVITRGEMQDWLLSMRARLGATTVLVTHDIEEALYLSDRILIMQGAPAAFAKEIVLEQEQRDREWLFAQRALYGEIYYFLKG